MLYCILEDKNRSNKAEVNLMNCQKKDCEILKIVITVIGTLTAIAAIAIAAYVLFKKYFKITFESDDEMDECDCDGCYIEKDDTSFEPVCDCGCGYDATEE